jgi:hypothetical protein
MSSQMMMFIIAQRFICISLLLFVVGGSATVLCVYSTESFKKLLLTHSKRSVIVSKEESLWRAWEPTELPWEVW